MFSEDDLQRLAPFTGNPEEVVLESLLKGLTHEVPNLKLKVVEFSKFVDQLAECGYKDYQRPAARKNFDFSFIDVKTIRILNRLTQHISKEIEKFTLVNKIRGQLDKD